MSTVTVSTSFRILGMSWGHYQHAVAEAPAPLPGIISVAADLVSGTASVESKNFLGLLAASFEVAL